MKIALYGGSFNPPHISHVLSATYVSMVENFDKIFVIPCFSSVTGKNLLPFRHRINMSSLAFKNIPNIYVSNIEDSLPIPSYTLNTVMKFKEIYPEAEIHLIVGADIMETQHLWKPEHLKEINDLVKLFIIGRDGFDYKCEVVMPNISSTEIQKLIYNKDFDKLSKLLPYNVLEYIKEHKLYA